MYVHDLRKAQEFKAAVQGGISNSDDDDTVDMSPMPLLQSDADRSKSNDTRAYGKNLLPGEGEALVAYVQHNLYNQLVATR